MNWKLYTKFSPIRLQYSTSGNYTCPSNFPAINTTAFLYRKCGISNTFSVPCIVFPVNACIPRFQYISSIPAFQISSKCMHSTFPVTFPVYQHFKFPVNACIPRFQCSISHFQYTSISNFQEMHAFHVSSAPFHISSIPAFQISSNCMHSTFPVHFQYTSISNFQ